jgi:hypothetical protein
LTAYRLRFGAALFAATFLLGAAVLFGAAFFAVVLFGAAFLLGAAVLFGAVFFAGDLRLVAAFLFVAIAVFQFPSLFYS